MVNDDRATTDQRLRRIQVITDAALSRLDAAGALDQLLHRLRDVLEVDTAAILVLDPHARQLVATAAKGLEEEVWEGFRVAIGDGFAGRVAQTKQPLALTDVTAADVVSHVLLNKGVRSLLGVPMLAGGALVGVLHVGSRARREFTDDDVYLLQLAADRASLAAQARAHSLEQAAALALQRSLLPPQLPEVPGVDMAARYVPGHDLGIGGDWYDVFGLPSGWVGAVIGDVSGHGLRSAVIMGRLRSALRSYALVCDDPAQVLTMLDRKIHHFEAGSLATALYAVISPDRAAVHVSLAGHLRPVLALPGQQPTMPPIPVDPPLGIGLAGRPRRTEVLDFPPGAALVCYTDGLVERRGEVIDTGFARLIEAVHPSSAEEMCATVMLGAAADQHTDDIALLAVRRDLVPTDQPGGRCAGNAARPLLAVEFTAGELGAVRHEVEAVSRRSGMDGDALDDWVTAVNELMVNAVRHGGGAGQVTLRHEGRLVCEVRDRGTGFVADAYLARATRPPVSPTGGMGLWIVRQMAEVLSLTSGPGGTAVRVTVKPA
ncbi:MAG TPA: SpoIIE family protein phosphatase [Pilimelia sp.]|nr:SpoIIE family protein phosphatase [Pilimelia sp.]